MGAFSLIVVINLLNRYLENFNYLHIFENRFQSTGFRQIEEMSEASVTRDDSRVSRKSGGSSSRPVSSRPGEPIALNWSCEEVQEWISDIGFPQYRRISSEVRELLGIELIPWDRSIADPPRDQMGLFLERKRPTGPFSDSLAFTDFIMGKGQ